MKSFICFNFKTWFIFIIYLFVLLIYLNTRSESCITRSQKSRCDGLICVRCESNRSESFLQIHSLFQSESKAIIRSDANVYRAAIFPCRNRAPSSDQSSLYELEFLSVLLLDSLTSRFCMKKCAFRLL